MSASAVPAPITQRGAGSPFVLVGLAALALLVLSPSFSAGFLNWDDPWMIEENPELGRWSWGALESIWADFDRRTRMRWGAEYLPVRDTSMLLSTALWGKSPVALRLVNVAWYLLACAAFRVVCLALLGRDWRAEVAAIAYAVHPAHVESVVWCSARKDVLAMAFVWTSLWLYGRVSDPAEPTSGRRARVLSGGALLMLACAVLSRSLTVVTPALWLAADWYARRRPRFGTVAAAAAVSLGATAVHLYVGGIVDFVGEPLGGSRVTAFWSMGPVWLRYLENALVPLRLSIVYDVDPLSRPTLVAVAGYLMWGAWTAIAVVSARRGRRGPGLLLVWFAAPLVPVSQIWFPIQTAMADRYLLLSASSAALFFAGAWSLAGRLPGSRALRLLARGLVVVVLAGWALVAARRSYLFADSARVFADATLKTTSALAPYQWGLALQDRGNEADALPLFVEAIARSDEPSDTARRARNNAARLYARAGALDAAEAVLREGLRHYPDDGKMRQNMEKVLAKKAAAERALQRGR